jgi:long-chain fatty acid transport protein
VRALPVAILITVTATQAWAGGMFLAARGARPLGRAGAYVAGADDLESAWYNPAGLAGTGHGSFLLDIGLVFQSVEYDRVDAGKNMRPPAYDDNGILPIPFLGVSLRPEALGKRVTFAFAFFAPYTGIPRYAPDGAQRYSLVSLDGTFAAIAELAASVRITPELYLGIGLQNLYFSLNNTIVLSGCTEINCSPEDPHFDSPTQTKVTSAFTPSANFGALYVKPKFRIGLSVQLPFFVHATGTVHTKLPEDPQFDGSVVVGDKIAVELNLPAIFRAGVELRPTKQLRIEVGADYETWQLQDKIRFVPDGVYIDHVASIGRYDLRPMELERNMQGVFALHVGGEYDILPKRLTARAGYMFETSSMPDETVSVLTPDGDKHLLALGLALRLSRFRFDVGYGHFIQPDRVITSSASYQLNPIQPSLPVGVTNGRYAVSTDVLTLGVEGRF